MAYSVKGKIVLVPYTVQTVVCKVLCTHNFSLGVCVCGAYFGSHLRKGLFSTDQCGRLNFQYPVEGVCPLRGEEFPVELMLVPGSGYHQHLGLLAPGHSQNVTEHLQKG